MVLGEFAALAAQVPQACQGDLRGALDLVIVLARRSRRRGVQLREDLLDPLDPLLELSDVGGEAMGCLGQGGPQW